MKFLKKVTLALAPVIFALVMLELAMAYLRPMLVGATGFAVDDVEKIAEIIVEQGECRLTLTKAEIWQVNGLERANPHKIDDVLHAFEQLQVAYPLPENLRYAYDSARHNAQALRVVLRDRWGAMRRYAFCRVDSLTVAEVRGDKPYVVELSGNPGIDVASLFSANPLFWYPTTAIAVEPSRIRQLTIENILQPQHSFSLAVDTAGRGVLTLLQSGKQVASLNTDRMYRYLSYFRSVVHERYATELDSAQVADIVAHRIAYRITIAAADSTATIAIFSKPADMPTDDFGRPATIDLNRCYLRCETSPHLAIARWGEIDLLLVHGEWFLGAHK